MGEILYPGQKDAAGKQKVPSADELLNMIRNGLIRKEIGEPFPANFTFTDVVDEVLSDAEYLIRQEKAISKKKIKTREPLPNGDNPKIEMYVEGNSKVTQTFMVEVNGRYRSVTMDFDLDKNFNCGEITKAKDEEYSEKEREYMAVSVCLPELNARILQDVTAALKGFRNELKATDSILFSPSKEYEDFENSFNSYVDRLNQNIDSPFINTEQIGELMSEYKESCQTNMNEYIQKKIHGDSLSTTQLDRLRICNGIYQLMSRVANVITYENDYKFAKDEETKEEARKRLDEARNSLTNYNILKDKVANNMLFGDLKDKGPNVAHKALKDEEAFFNPNSLNDMQTKLKDSAEFRNIIGEKVTDSKAPNYGNNIDNLYELSKKSPSSLQKKLAAQRSETVAETTRSNSSYQWKNSPEEQRMQSDIRDKIKAYGNPTLASICEYTMRLTDKMVTELDASESIKHSDEYKLFRSELEAAHNKIIKNIQEKLDTGRPGPEILDTLTDTLKGVVNAADLYQKKHEGKTLSGAGDKIAKRLEIATGVKVLNDYLTKEANKKAILSGSPEAMKGMTRKIGKYRIACDAFNEDLKKDRKNADKNFSKFTVYDKYKKWDADSPVKDVDVDLYYHGSWSQLAGDTKALKSGSSEKKYANMLKVKQVAEKMSPEEQKQQRKNYNEGNKELNNIFKDLKEEVKNAQKGHFDAISGKTSKLTEDIDVKGFTDRLKEFSDKYGDFDNLAENSGKIIKVVKDKSRLPADDPTMKTLNELAKNAELAGKRVSLLGGSKQIEQDAWKITHSAFGEVGLKEPEVKQLEEEVKNI